MLTCRINIHTDRINTILDSLIQRFLKLTLINIMLILSYSDRFRIYFHQFRKRIHQTPADRYSTSYSYIILRKFFSGNFRSRINRCTIFTDDKYLDFSIITQIGNKIFCFPTCRTITDRYCLNVIYLY